MESPSGDDLTDDSRCGQYVHVIAIGEDKEVEAGAGGTAELGWPGRVSRLAGKQHARWGQWWCQVVVAGGNQQSSGGSVVQRSWM